MAVAFKTFQMQQIVEQQGPFFDPFTFFPSLTREMLAADPTWHGTAVDPASGKLIMAVQSYIVRTPHHTILIDSCVGNEKERVNHPFWHRAKGDAYARGFAKAGLSFDDIDIVLCTHLHVDHVGWNTQLRDGRWVPTFRNARYLFSGHELAFWTELNKTAPVPWIVDSVLPVVAAGQVDQVTSDHVLDDYVRLEPTPGHTIDHFAVQLGRGQTEAVVAGDLIHSPIQLAYPAVSMFRDYDPAQSAATRRRFLDCYCDTRTLICTAHFPGPSTGRVQRKGDAFKLVSEAL
jgi:glyoxylase-like metal-dependent hydrolase (beta-lactamase superfamily II)